MRVKIVGGGQVGVIGWVTWAKWVTVGGESRGPAGCNQGTPDQALGMGEDSGALSIHSLTMCSLPCALCMDGSRWGGALQRCSSWLC